MGCDINLFREKRINGKWFAADIWEKDDYEEGRLHVPWKKRFTDRDYDLFGFLASGVRCDHDFSFEVRGFPFNASSEVRQEFEAWGTDAHSASYLTVDELKEAWGFLQSKTVKVSGMKHRDEISKLMASINSNEETDWMLLYPYCGWCSSSDYEKFEVDVPASFQLSGVKRLIDLFNGMDGDSHRIVFWFDN